MYIIGTDDWHFINIKSKAMYDGRKVFWKIEQVTYNIPSQANCEDNSMSIIKSNFTILNNLEDAKKDLIEIKDKKDNIRFENNFMIEEIIDKENNKKFDVETLKIYELVPTEIKEEEE